MFQAPTQRYLCCIGLLVLVVTLAQSQATEPSQRLFENDQQQPLDINDRLIETFTGGALHEVTYASPKGGRVTAYLVVPDGKGPFATVLFGHWGNGTRSEFIPEAKTYARAGAISLIPDYPWERAAQWRKTVDNFDHPEKDREAEIQAVVDLRRGIDLLLSRSDVDPKRLAYIGHSYGAQWGAILSAIDKRLKTSVLMGGVASAHDLFYTSQLAEVQGLRDSMKDKLESYTRGVSDLDAIRYVNRAAPVALLMQFGNFEQYFDRESAQRYAAAASEPKSLKYYDTGHDLNDPQASLDRYEWLVREIGLSKLNIFPTENASSSSAIEPGEGRGKLWRQEAKKAAEATNANGEVSGISAIAQLHDDFPENARVARNYAWAELRSGKPDAALQALQQYAAMGMTLNPGGPIYEAFAKVGLIDKVPELARNRSAVSHGTLVFTFNDSGLLPEDIAFDTRSHRLLLTSARKKKIVSCDLTGECRDVVISTTSHELDGMLAIHIDQQRNILWATTSGMAMQEGFRPERKGKSALLKYDLTNFRLLKRYEPDDGREHALGDMTVASNGDAYVSDGLSGDVYVVRSSTDKLEQLLPAGVFVSPQTPALNGDETILYVPDYVEGIAAIDLKSRNVAWVRISQPVALDGIDGLYWRPGALIATQNGTLPERVVRLHLRDKITIDGFDVIEANWPGLGDPTHGVIVGDDFYFIVNSGWDRIGEDGSTFKPGTPAQVWTVQVKR